jgi:hypothetical protein
MSIRPDNLTLDKLLQGRLFRIPDYQRAYSWESKQREDLFGDIRKLAQHTKSERRHFMSTVVCLQTSEREEVGADEFGVFHVVDGQQRLTTLIIILKSLAKKLASGNDAEIKESGKLNELLVKENGRLILLQTNHDSKLLFRNYLEKGIIPEEENVETLADRNMIRAFKECEVFVEHWVPDSLSLLKLVKNRLDFIFYVLEDEGSVHTTFEVLNSRGLEVDWLDKCKSMLMGIAFERLEVDARTEYIEELRDCWTKIYKTIGLKKISGQEILKFAATLENSNSQSKINSPENAMDFFRKKCGKNPKIVIEVSANFLKITEQLERLSKNPRLNAVTKISHARLLAVAIMLNESLDKNSKQKILKEWEKVTFRIFGMCRKDSRTKVGDYVRLAREIISLDIRKEIDSKGANVYVDSIIKKIANLGEDYPANEASQQLREKNCYEGW